MDTNQTFKLLVLTIIFSFQNCSQAQEETFIGNLNGSDITLYLKKENNTYWSGKLVDEYQTYSITANGNQNCLEGNAIESNLNITLRISGCVVNDTIEMRFDFSSVGLAEIKTVMFTKSSNESKKNNSSKHLVTNGKRDLTLVGLWKQEQLYSSGSGDTYFGGSFTQKVILYADGSIADGGSQATMSGSDYSGNSSSGSGSKAPGVSWSTSNSHLFFTVTQNGQTQTIDAGKYYVEDGKMLITSNEGSKTLLIKVQ